VVIIAKAHVSFSISCSYRLLTHTRVVCI